MYDFNVILGIDWLSTHQALVNCFIDKVVFQKPKHSKFEIECGCKVSLVRVILALKATRLLHQGCKVYLARMIDSLKVTLECVQVVQKFSNVFLMIYQVYH